MNGLGADIPGKSFTYTCPGSLPRPADQIEQGIYIAECNKSALTGDYNVTASF
jgi:hypothetical protein